MGSNAWLFWALASAGFASLTAIFAKLGLQGVDSDFATFIRTLVIIAALSAFLTYAKKWQPLGSLSAKNWLFLILSGLATGASWLAYFKALQMGDASQVAPIDKLSVVLVAVFAVVMSLIGAFYYLRVVRVMYFEDATRHEPMSGTLAAKWVLSANALLLLVWGVMPAHLTEWIKTAVERAF